jgi:hypothetical protein
MALRFHKHKILLDENFPPRLTYPRLNGMFDVKHLRDDLGGGGITDDQVYDLASKLRRIVVTFNAKDFKKLTSKSNTTGVIGVSPLLPTHQIDMKLTALLVRSSEKALLGKFTPLTRET